MVTNNIDWGLDNNKGVSFFTINKGLNKLILQEAQLLITFEQAINKLNNSISVVSNKLVDIVKNLAFLNKMDYGLSKFAMLASIGSAGLVGYAAIAAAPTEESSAVAQKVYQMGMGQGTLGSKQFQLLLKGIEGSIGSGIIMSILQAYCSYAKGLDNSKTMKFQAFTDAYKQDLKLFEGSEDKGFKTIQAIAKAEQKGIEEEYRSKSRELYYNK